MISAPTTDWLVVIDMQPAFGNDKSPWFVPGYAACAEKIVELVDLFQERVLFTCFIPPTQPHGAWRSYYAKHRFALEPRHHALWNLDPRWTGRRCVSSHRFAKWREAAALIPQDSTLVLCGVATDCCVLGTAIEANDEGRKVRLIADACAAGTSTLHDAALCILGDRDGLLEVTDSQAEISRQSALLGR